MLEKSGPTTLLRAFARDAFVSGEHALLDRLQTSLPHEISEKVLEHVVPPVRLGAEVLSIAACPDRKVDDSVPARLRNRGKVKNLALDDLGLNMNHRVKRMNQGDTAEPAGTAWRVGERLRSPFSSGTGARRAS